MPVLWLTPQPVMSTGKAAAQVGHASMLLAALLAADGRAATLERWAADGYRCAVRTASVQQWADLAVGKRPDRAWREWAPPSTDRSRPRTCSASVSASAAL